MSNSGGAKIYAEVVGYGATCDAYHMTAPAPDGSGGASAMALALADGGIRPEEVDYINAHGTSTPLNDKGETAAVKAVFGDWAYRLAMSSTKSMTGHMLGAAGAVEAIFSALALVDGYLPATIHYRDCLLYTSGQGEAIARTLARMSALTVPVVSVITGEGGSGGALALGVGNVVLMQENAVYSVLSPEGFAAILWKDAGRAEVASGVMKLTAPDLRRLGVIDGIIAEPPGGAHTDPAAAFAAMDRALTRALGSLRKQSGEALAAQRYQKFRAMGDPAGKKERA